MSMKNTSLSPLSSVRRGSRSSSKSTSKSISKNGQRKQSQILESKHPRSALPFYEKVLNIMAYIRNKILFVLDIHPDSSVHINEYTWEILYSNTTKSKDTILKYYKQKLNKKLGELFPILHIFFCSGDIQKYKFLLDGNTMHIKNSPGDKLHKHPPLSESRYAKRRSKSL